MYKESPALGESARLEVKEIETEQSNSKTTVFDPRQFQPITSDYARIIADREREARLRLILPRLATRLLYLQRSGLVRFAQSRIADGEVFDVEAWLFLMARIIQALAGRTLDPFAERWDTKIIMHPPLSRAEVRSWAEYAGFYGLTEEQLEQAEALALDHYAQSNPKRSWIDADEVGQLLGLTAVERDHLKFWLAGSIDETREQRCERKAREKRERNRLAKAARDEAARQAGKRKSAAQRRAEKEEREAILARLMVEHGKSRRTIENWLADGDPRAEELRLLKERRENCANVVADIDRETLIGRPLQCNPAGPPCRAFEPEPAVPTAEPALAWLGHKEVSDERRVLWLSREVLDRMRQAVR
jgi:hypothetical protein